MSTTSGGSQETVEVAGVEIDVEEYRQIQTSEIKRRMLVGLCKDPWTADAIQELFKRNNYEVKLQTIRNYLIDFGKAGLARRLGDRQRKALWEATEKGHILKDYLDERFNGGM